MIKPWIGRTIEFLALLTIADATLAEVKNIEINSRRPIAAGRDFATTGPYEELIGRIYFEIDPTNPHNQIIEDLSIAPRNNSGMVEVSADIEILTPLNPENGNGVALVDIVNRGGKVALSFNQPTENNEYGDGFLMEQGYTIVWIGWEFDINAGVRIDVPHLSDLANSPIGGLGFAAVRDTAAWLKYSPTAEISTDYAISFGLSQSGRFLHNYLYLGFNSDEQNRKVFDGVIPHIAGASRIDLNRRGAEPVSSGQYTATSYPFTDSAYPDPVTGATEGILENYRSESNQPYVFHTNTSAEYWGGGRVTALVHSTPDGKADATLPANVRFYFLAGTQHGPGAFPPAQPVQGQQMENPMNYWWNLRALLTAMKEWVVDDISPPSSAHPSFAADNLVTPTSIHFPAITAVHSPVKLTAGSRVANPLIPDNGGVGSALPLLIPQVNLDGNETSGIRHPELSVPLATYTGWNFNNPANGDPNQLSPLTGAYIPFASTRAEREKNNDPRLSIEERYSSKADYLQQVRLAGEALINQRYLLPNDLSAILARADQHWNLRQAR